MMLRVRVLVLLLPMLPGCATGTLTLVEGSLYPKHFQFVTVVNQQGDEPGGWRAACLHVPIRRDIGDAFICKLGIEMPIKTEVDGMISAPLAQRIAADCANLAAQVALGSTTPTTPLGFACESFKGAFHSTLRNALRGSVVKTICHKATEPVVVGQ
ncbi:hypothetical protein [Hyalangium rubrum]|uniref:Lipoprotein n=1 Tax=Hyalangium rubrum TaxID=3103134 RepID=A0ABU5HF30_9BACT|nr:hypothetical protein [Hyalangium sp. s54d21]MDY7231479.1 hypothetical protein [Hyalangium sp. s54d21]